MGAPVLSHLDPEMMAILDDIRSRLGRVFRAADGSIALAISGTGTSGMEAAVANLTRPGTRAVAVVTGYFGDRLAQMLQRYGATVTRVDGEWGRACDPARLEAALAGGADLVTMVQAETSTGVLNPVAEMCAMAADRGAMTIVDAVTSLGAHPVDAGAWGADAVYSCTQKGLGAPSGLAPIVFSKRARERAEGIAIVLLRSETPRRLLGRSQVPPHHLGAARLCAARGARGGRGGRARGALGAASRQSPRARGRARHARTAVCCRRRRSGSGRSTPCRCPTEWTRRASASACSTSTASRSAPASARSPGRSGASA